MMRELFSNEFRVELRIGLGRLNLFSREVLKEFFVVLGTKGTEGLNITRVVLFELVSELEIMLLMVEIRLDAVIRFFEADGFLSALSSSTRERGVILRFVLLIIYIYKEYKF